jgi:hypothetical protein
MRQVQEQQWIETSASPIPHMSFRVCGKTNHLSSDTDFSVTVAYVSGVTSRRKAKFCFYSYTPNFGEILA